MKFLLEILLIFGLCFLFYALNYANSYIRHKINSKKYPDYARELSSTEIDYLLDAEKKLEVIGQQVMEDSPKWYRWFLGLALVPMMMLCWCFLLLCIGIFYRLLGVELSGGTSDWHYGVIPILIGIFSGIFFAGWLLYIIIQRKSLLALSIAVNSGMYVGPSYGNTVEVRGGQTQLLERQIRKDPQIINEPFDEKQFLFSRNLKYKKITRNGFLILSAIMMIAICVDIVRFKLF